MNKFLSNFTAPLSIIYGFLLTILIGTFLLVLPISSSSGEATNVIDALFTATSAVCITGLTVVITVEHWSIFGQWVILALIQVGGLGFMSLVTMVFLFMRKKITMRERNVIQAALNINQNNGVVSFAKYILKFTIICELIGAFVLSVRFYFEGTSVLTAIRRGIFHSVSAFCNAGFDILGNSSLEKYYGDVTINLTIMALITIGGLGFPVVLDIYGMLKNIFIKKYSLKFCINKLSLQSKIVIVMTLALIFSGAFLFFIFEYNNSLTMGNMTLFEKIMSSFFQSVTLRTAGFATINQGNLGYGSTFISIILMFIGGSPAGTAGGAKTVTIAILIISILSLVKGKDEIYVFNRNIGLETLQKALSVVIMMIIVVVVAVVLLSVSDANLLINNGGKFELLDMMYEVVSAIATVGNSTGMTSLLSKAGKLILIVCMYIGRVGPISLAIALSSNKNTKNNIRYPEGKVIVG